MNLYQKLITIFLLIEEQLSMLQFFKSRTYTFHPQIVIKTFEGNGKNLSIVIKTFESTGKSLPPPSIISKEDERSMSQGRISEGDKPPVQQEKSGNNVSYVKLSLGITLSKTYFLHSGLSGYKIVVIKHAQGEQICLKDSKTYCMKY